MVEKLRICIKSREAWNRPIYDEMGDCSSGNSSSDGALDPRYWARTWLIRVQLVQLFSIEWQVRRAKPDIGALRARVHL